MAKKEEEGWHEHVCSNPHLKKYRCNDPADADLLMGLCPECRAAEQSAEPKPAKKKKGSKKR